MAGFIAKQPNGLYCRFSTVVDCPTNWNMTAEDYIELCKQKSEQEAKDVLENYLQPFEMVKERFYPNNMTEEEFDKFLQDVGDTPRTPKERGADKPKITCLNCKHLMFSDMYGECNKQLKIVNPSDTCEYAEPKERGGEK